MTPRYTGKCGNGHHVTGTARELTVFVMQRPEHRGFATKCHCGETIHLHDIKAKRGAVRKGCGAWCTDGTGRSCTCECEGRNHGTTYSHTGALWQMS